MLNKILSRIVLFLIYLNSVRLKPHFLKLEIGFNRPLFWGRKFPYSLWKNLKTKFKNPYFLEDGFISYVPNIKYPLSIIVDDIGIYYDCNSLSKLDLYLNESLNDKQRKEASSVIETYKRNKISKYNFYRDIEYKNPKEYVLLIDQVFGDLSVRYGNARKSSFSTMLKDALDENTSCHVFIKTHPRAKKNKSYFDDNELLDPRIRLIEENCHISTLIENAKMVYVVTSNVGFEALMYGKKVKCYGMPFYAGRGLTEDYINPPINRKKITLEELVYAALIRYPKYYEPIGMHNVKINNILSFVGTIRETQSRLPSKLKTYGFSFRKKCILKNFTQGSEVKHISSISSLGIQDTLLVWGSYEPDGLEGSTKVIRVEDGFIRSIGLGSNFVKPASWVFDKIGIYYDSTKPSSLENILNYKIFSQIELDRAKRLIKLINNSKITKYNLAPVKWVKPKNTKHIALVIGQVEDDMSIKMGTYDIDTNYKLLKKVREINPDAYIVFKQHPDIVSGGRKNYHNSAEKDLYDEILSDGDVCSLFGDIDSLHTMTSLSGFEALLRGVNVFCYGVPFYSGWGLTNDLIKISRRKNKIDIYQLVAAALIDYPTYFSYKTNSFTTPEKVIEEISLKK